MTVDNQPQPRQKNTLFRRFANNISLIYIRLFFRLEYEGLENVPATGPAILVANHTGSGDMLAIHTAIRPWICWVAKKELFENKFLGSALLKLGCIPVDRNKTDLMAARGIFTALRNGQVVGMFPQGTRVRPDRIPYVIPRSGAVHFAIKTGVPIIPVGISAPFKIGSKICIVFGNPFELGLSAHGHYSADLLNELTVDVMRRVYTLVGYDYQLADTEIV